MQMHPELAVIRFGLGRRADADLPADPQAWLMAQLDGPGTPVYPAGLSGVADAFAALDLRRQMEKATKMPVPPKDDPVAQSVKRDIDAECAQWIGAADSFRERMVMFWANHFTTSRKNGDGAVLIGDYVRQAIRPNINGDFGALLLAVMRHPSMLVYLNNDDSLGPHSIAGLHQHKGLNENLGRECLELHTLSTAAGYTQADVTSMAAILTGWSVQRKGPDAGFVFRPRTHEPGPKSLLGQQFPEGEEGGIAALAFLAQHPATARHIALKLARHFAADNPPPALVDRLTTRYLDTGGHLPSVMACLIQAPEVWSGGLTKLRTPVDFVCAGLRAVNPTPDHWAGAGGAMGQLGQPVWAAPSPKGWSDLASDWIDPALLLRRVEYGYQLGGLANNQDVRQLTDVALGRYATPTITNAVSGAGSRREAVALLFSSLQFWRR